jgi:hypothetical protein
LSSTTPAATNFRLKNSQLVKPIDLERLNALLEQSHQAARRGAEPHAT